MKERDEPQTSRSWCFTRYGTEPKPLNEYPIRYYIWQKEECPKTKRIHWQGYVEFSEPVRVKRCQTLMGIPDTHLGVRWGTRDEARNYCRDPKKVYPGATPVEWGNWDAGGQGTRNDLTSLLNKVKEGATMLEIIETNPELYGKYRNTIKDYKFEVLKSQTKTFRQVNVEVHWGEAGTGKTRHCVESYPNAYKLDFDDNIWWDGYEGETTLIINDFYGNIKYHKLLDLLDGYQMRLPVKGGHTYANWNKVLITSNKPPEQWYHHGMTPALKRRIGETRYWGNTEPSTVEE